MVKYTRLALVFSLFTPFLVKDAVASDGRAEFETASRFFDAEEYEAALPYFRQAYELSGKRPATIFALAQCERAVKRYQDAINHFREFLGTGPSKSQEAEVLETLKLLEDLERSRLAQEREEATKLAVEREAQRTKEAAEQAKREAEQQKAKEQQAALEKRLKDEAAQAAAKIAEQTAQQLRDDMARAEAERQRQEEEKKGGFFSSPIFWVAASLAVAGGATAAVFMLRPEADAYAGTTGVLLIPGDRQ